VREATNVFMVDKHEMLTLLGARIRSLREARGFSQEGFAAHAGLDRAYYGGIERGERNVAAHNLMRIAIALKVEVGELFPPIEEFS
jgi:transcriptional regulator with XRE-family HTH domain